MSEFKLLAIGQIKPDPNQPRKFYEESAMNELIDSVKQKGILQPILVRPKGKSHLLVCGERRYRAAKEAGLTEIPAVIRELTDEEALELQIIENLQRKDVHPMEEAVAFKSLSEKFSIEEIAMRVGKSASFVAKRIKLTDLVKDAQDIFFMGKMDMSDAIKLAKLDPRDQDEIIKERAPKNWRNSKQDWHLGNIEWMIREKEQDLAGAVFKANDKNLYPEAGACNVCPHNSANHPLLFDDQKKRICARPVCFEIKTQRALKLKFEKVAADPSKICVVLDSYLTDDEKKRLKAAEEVGIKILDRRLYERHYNEPDPVASYEDWFKENYDYYDEDELAELKPADLQKEYAVYKKEQEEEISEYNNAVSAGRIVKAFVIAGNNEGKEVNILLKSIGAKNIVEAQSGNAGDAETLSEIEKIETREKRNKELDGEKIWQEIMQLIRSQENKKVFVTDLLTSIDHTAITHAMIDKISHSNMDWVEQILGEDYEEIKKISFEQFCAVSRVFVCDVLMSGYGSHLEEGSNNYKAYQFLLQYLPNEIKLAETKQQETAEQRQERVAKRIGALKKKLTHS